MPQLAGAHPAPESRCFCFNILDEVQTAKYTKTHIIHGCQNICHATMIISKDVPRNKRLMTLYYCAGSNKGWGWPRETRHTAFLLGWFSNEFPTTAKTCSYVKHQFSGKKSDNHLVLHTNWICHFLVWLLLGTSLVTVMSFSYSLLHNIFNSVTWFLSTRWHSDTGSTIFHLRLISLVIDIYCILQTKRHWSIRHSDFWGKSFRKDVLYLWTVRRTDFRKRSGITVY
jgi:hypothetical protein